MTNTNYQTATQRLYRLLPTFVSPMLNNIIIWLYVYQPWHIACGGLI